MSETATDNQTAPAGTAGGDTASTEAGSTTTAGQPGVTEPASQNVDTTAQGNSDGKAEGISTETDTEKTSDKGNEAPTAYTDFTIPEGSQTDPELLKEFTDAALKAGLKQEQAQQLIDMGAKMQQKILTEHFAAVEQQKADWETAARADKEYGGAKFEENMAHAAKAAEALITPALKEQLDRTGLGNHPDLIRAFIRVGKLISEDSLVPGSSKPTVAGKNAASTLYPYQN